jgi:hypothetical protein
MMVVDDDDVLTTTFIINRSANILDINIYCRAKKKTTT